MKKYLYSLALLPALLALSGEPLSGLPHGDYYLQFIDQQNLVLTANYGKFMAQDPLRHVPRYRAQIIAAWRQNDAVSVRDEAQQNLVVGTPGYWYQAAALLRTVQGQISPEADVMHFLYLQLKRPLRHHEKLVVKLPDGTVLNPVYTGTEISPLFKINQLGYGAQATKKFAYLGLWCGTRGAFNLHQYWGKKFRLCRASDGQTVWQGTIRRRWRDPLYQQRTPFTGEEVAELNFSAFTTEGRYFLAVDGIGRSADFELSSGTVSEAFYLHARGLYHKRCGLAKTWPYTAWIAPACHRQVQRGNFPGITAHYRKGPEKWGFFDEYGSRIAVKHFDLIRENSPLNAPRLTVKGGWHDAADYDRRSEHLEIVNDLTMTFLLRPQNFIDGQLNIPESGNGIPDLLDEAAWGLRHLLIAQQPDGGVGTWFETTGHPQAGQGLPDQDKFHYFIAAPSRESTLNYTAAAAQLAWALHRAGAERDAQVWRQSAERGWQFALNQANELRRTYRYHGRNITYREAPELPAPSLVAAGVALYELTGNEQYRQPLERQEKKLIEAWNRDSWRWSPLSWLGLFVASRNSAACHNLKTACRQKILREASQMIVDQESNYPYRTLWPKSTHGAVHAMAWGNYHPLRRSRTLVAAHFLTQARSYLQGIYLANDFHNGANPLGQSMTSGLGKIYPAAFLDLISYADNCGEFVPGITPYGNTFGLDRRVITRVYGLFERRYGAAQGALFPQPGASETACRAAINQLWPIWRRRVNLEMFSVPSSEYSVWETIGPAAAVTGYLLEKAQLPTPKLLERRPGTDFRRLPGYTALP